MIVLAFDTAAEACSAAVRRDGETLARRAETLGRGHAERLFPMLEEVLAEAGLGWRDLDRIGVVAGPGSFTGLRVGVAAARGLSLALDRPAIGLDGFAAVAADVATEGDCARLAVCWGKPARLRWRLFAARGGLATPLADVQDGDVDALIAAAPSLIAGSATEALADTAAAAGIAGAGARRFPDPATLARLTAEAEAGAEPPKPLYARPPDAAPAAPAAPRLPGS